MWKRQTDKPSPHNQSVPQGLTHPQLVEQAKWLLSLYDYWGFGMSKDTKGHAWNIKKWIEAHGAETSVADGVLAEGREVYSNLRADVWSHAGLDAVSDGSKAVLVYIPDSE